jgi:hypothetical protein
MTALTCSLIRFASVTHSPIFRESDCVRFALYVRSTKQLTHKVFWVGDHRFRGFRMSVSSEYFSNLRHDLLESIDDEPESGPSFASSLNVHGMYETRRFVLRLSPRNHELIDMISSAGFKVETAPSEVIQAYSTYIHETIHWWQHVGSTSGLLFSLSYLAQCHSNMEELVEVLATLGAKKSLKRYTEQILRAEGDSAQSRLASANIAVNNAQDVEYYKSYAYSPRTNIHWMIREPHFESVGHGYFVVYGQLNGMLADVIDPEYVILPNPATWDSEILRLREERIVGYHWRSRSTYQQSVCEQFMKVRRGSPNSSFWMEPLVTPCHAMSGKRRAISQASTWKLSRHS